MRQRAARAGRRTETPMGGRRTWRVLFLLMVYLGVLGTAMAGKLEGDQIGTTGAPFIAVAYDGEIVIVRDANGRAWNVRLVDGCRFVVLANPRGPMPVLQPSAVPDGPMTDEQCKDAYRKPESIGTRGDA